MSDILKEALMNLWCETFNNGLTPIQAQARINFLVDSIKNPNKIELKGTEQCVYDLHQLIRITDEERFIDDNYMVYELDQRSKDYRVTLIKYSYYKEFNKDRK